MADRSLGHGGGNEARAVIHLGHLERLPAQRPPKLSSCCTAKAESRINDGASATALRVHLMLGAFGQLLERCIRRREMMVVGWG